MDLCAVCNVDVRIKGGKKRVSFGASLEQVKSSVYAGLLDVFPLQLTPLKSGRGKSSRFLCRPCFGLLSTLVKKKKEFEDRVKDKSLVSSRKRERTPHGTPVKRPRVSTPVFKGPSTPRSKKKEKRETFKDTVIKYIEKGMYRKAMAHLLAHSHTAVLEFRELIVQEIKQELQGYSQTNTITGETVNMEKLESFSWEKVADEARTCIPTLFHCLKTCASFSRSKSTQPSESDIHVSVGTALSVLLYCARPMKWKFIPALFSVMLYRGGCAKKIVTCLHNVGLCQTYSTALIDVDRIGKDNIRNLTFWKGAMEGKEPVIDESTHEEAESQADEHVWLTDEESESIDELTVPKKSKRRLFQEENDDEPRAKANENVVPGFSVCFDNVGIEEKARHQGTKNKTVHVWTSAFATLNRVTIPRSLEEPEAVHAETIPLRKFLPCDDDTGSRQISMYLVIGNILKAHMATYKDVEIFPRTPIYEEEMAAKSQIATIGIIQTNPGTRDGCLTVLDELHKFVPFPDGPAMAPSKIPVHGDGASVLGVMSAKRSRNASLTPTERLEGLWPVPGDFHRRMIQMQDTMNLLYKSESRGDAGTLANIKAVFSLKGVTEKTTESFNHIEDMLNLSTKGLVCLTAMKLLDLKSVDDILPLDDDDIQSSFWKLSQQIAEFFMKSTPMTDVLNCTEAETANATDVFCFCKEKLDGLLLRECGNIDCKNGRWFHEDKCVTDDIGEDEEWFCSEECKQSGGSLWCVCRKIKTEEMIECNAKDQCARGRRFHVGCVGYVKALSPKRRTIIPNMPPKWSCSPACLEIAGDEKQHDYVQEYSKALGFRGLLDMVNRQAIRDGDGDIINTEWRLSMVEFANLNHKNYFVIGHNLLAGVNGFWPESFAKEVTWNRTINQHGQPGCNIPMDRYNEFLNADFKRTLKDSSGRYTDKHIQRAGKMTGPMGKQLDTALARTVGETYIPGQHHTDQKEERQKDLVKEFVTIYQNDNLIGFVPKRKHKSFQNFSYTLDIKNADKLKEALIRHSKRMDILAANNPQHHPSDIEEVDNPNDSSDEGGSDADSCSSMEVYESDQQQLDFDEFDDSF